MNMLGFVKHMLVIYDSVSNEVLVSEQRWPILKYYLSISLKNDDAQ
jgi:hypothetical protein